MKGDNGVPGSGKRKRSKAKLYFISQLNVTRFYPYVLRWTTHMQLLTRYVRYDGGTPQEAAADQNDRDEDHLRDVLIN